jgi:translation initiation factor 4A
MIENESIKLYESFEEMSLRTNLLRGIYGYGFEKPSHIQKQAIVPMSSGRDIIAQAQSGTGKTGTFIIATLNQIDFDLNKPQAIILSPTKELCNQTADIIRDIGSRLQVNVMLAVGGSPVEDDIKRLKQGVHIVIGTVGRIVDLIKRKALKAETVSILVLDEADEMIFSFVDEIKFIVSNISLDSQIALFSATVPDFILEVSSLFMRDPIKILVNKEDLTLDGVEQYYIDVHHDDNKFSTLMDIYDSISISQCVIFCNSKEKVDILKLKLEQSQFTVSAIHSDLSTKERFEVLREFRGGKSKVLLSTDLIARGIDIQQVYMVINWDLPKSVNTYLHRIGRSGRFGRKGIAINFLTKGSWKKMKEIENHYTMKVSELPANIVNKIL